MTKKKEIPRDTFISAAADMLGGKSIRTATKDYQMSERDARWLSRNQGLCANEFRELVISKMQILQEELLDKIREKLDLIPPGQLAVTYGILNDKMEKTLPSINTLNVQNKIGIVMDGKTLSRDELLKMLADNRKKNKAPKLKHQPHKRDIIYCQ